jgi:hypothetical protein
MEKRIFLTLPGLELPSVVQSLASQSLYRLRYRCKGIAEVSIPRVFQNLRISHTDLISHKDNCGGHNPWPVFRFLMISSSASMELFTVCCCTASCMKCRHDFSSSVTWWKNKSHTILWISLFLKFTYLSLTNCTQNPKFYIVLCYSWRAWEFSRSSLRNFVRLRYYIKLTTAFQKETQILGHETQSIPIPETTCSIEFLLRSLEAKGY